MEIWDVMSDVMRSFRRRRLEGGIVVGAEDAVIVSGMALEALCVALMGTGRKG